MESHVDTHPYDYKPMFPMMGKITAIYAHDDPANPTGTFTLYQAVVYQRFPSAEHVFEPIPILGQMGGGSVEGENPLPLGTLVVINFLEGDANRPYIQGVWPSHATVVAANTVEQPRTKYLCRGNSFQIDSAGDVDVIMRNGGVARVTNSAGTLTLQISDTGEVLVGGDPVLGFRRLLTEDMVGALSAAFAGAAVIPNDGGAQLKISMAAALNAAFTTSNSTAYLKGR